MSLFNTLATIIWKMTPNRSIREKYFSVYCWLVRGKKRIVQIDGVYFSLDLGQTIDVAVSLGRFEPELVAAIHTHTKPGDTILDIGANTGVHAMVFAKCAVHGKVFAFEPTDYAFIRLKNNIQLNKGLNVEPIQLALSDRNADSEAVDFRSSWRTDGIVDHKMDYVSFRRLDDWMTETGLQSLNIIKLDVDGFEYPVLHGSPQTLSKFRPIIFMEIGLYHFDVVDKNPVTLLGDIGYSFWDAKSKVLISPSEIRQRLMMPEMSGITINVIASPIEGFIP